MLGRLSGQLPFPATVIGRTGGRVVGLGLVVALTAAVVPSWLFVVPIIGLALIAGEALTGQPGAGLRVAATAVLATAVATVLLLPWSATVLGNGTATLGVGAGTAGRLGFGQVIRFDTGPVGHGALGWGLLAAAALPLVIGREWRLAWATRLWVVAIGFFWITWAGSHGWVPALPVEVGLAPAAAALAGSVALGAVSFELDLPGYRFGWRQLAAAVAGVALAVASVPMLIASGGGRWKVPTADATSVLSFLPDSHTGDYRVLWVGAPGALPLAGRSLGSGMAFAASYDGEPSVADLWSPGNAGAMSVLAGDLRLVERRLTTKLGHLLAPMAVRYLVIPTANGPSSSGAATVATPAALLAGLPSRPTCSWSTSTPTTSCTRTRPGRPVGPCCRRRPGRGGGDGVGRSAPAPADRPHGRATGAERWHGDPYRRHGTRRHQDRPRSTSRRPGAATGVSTSPASAGSRPARLRLGHELHRAGDRGLRVVGGRAGHPPKTTPRSALGSSRSSRCCCGWPSSWWCPSTCAAGGPNSHPSRRCKPSGSRRWRRHRVAPAGSRAPVPSGRTTSLVTRCGSMSEPTPGSEPQAGPPIDGSTPPRRRPDQPRRPSGGRPRSRRDRVAGDARLWRIPILAALAGGLIVGGLIDQSTPSATKGAIAALQPFPAVAPAAAISSSWFCAGATDSANGNAPGSVLLANGASTAASGVVTLVTSAGTRRAVPVAIAGNSRAVVPETVSGGAPWIGAIVDIDAGDVAVQQQIDGALGRASSPCGTAGSSQWYFTSGATLINASVTLSLLNPYPTAAVADMSFTTDQGQEFPSGFQGLVVPADGLLTVNLGDHLRRRPTIATTVTARSGRLVVWKTDVVTPPRSGEPVLGTPAGESALADPASPISGVTLNLGAPAAATTWAWPEGFTGNGVNEQYVIYNPGLHTADLQLSIGLDAGEAEPFQLTVGPGQAIPVISNQEVRIPPVSATPPCYRASTACRSSPSAPSPPPRRRRGTGWVRSRARP